MIPSTYMVDRIERNAEESIKFLYSLLEKRIFEDDYSLSTFSTRAFRDAAGLIVINSSDIGRVRTLLALAGSAEAQSFCLAEYPKGSKTLELVLPTMKQTFLRQSTGPNSFSHPDRWLKAFYLSLVWWQLTDLELLLKTRMQTLHASTTKSVPCRYLQVKASQAVWARHPDTGEKIVEPWEAMSPEKLDSSDIPYAAFIAMHENGMLSKIQLGDEAGFNHEVKLALEDHEKYYSRSDKLRNSPEAWFSLPALGLSALALHRGMKVSIESRFLPLALISV